MSTIGYTTVLLQYQEEIKAILDQFVHGGYNAMMGYMQAPLAACSILYIVILGWATTHGWLKMTVSEVAKVALKIGLIYMFAMNWGNFSNTVITLFQNGADEIGGALLSAAPVSLPHTSGEGTSGALQSILIEISEVGASLWGSGGISHLGPLFGALFVWASGLFMIAVAFFEITMAEILQATLFTVAPLFLVFTLFKPCQGFFDRWVGALAGCSFVIILVNVTIAINCSIYQIIIVDYAKSNITPFQLISFVPLVIVSILAIFQIIKITDLAMGLGGSINAASGSAMVGSAVGSFLGTSFAMVRQTGSTVRGSGLFSKLGSSALKEGDTQQASALKRIQNNIRRGE